MYARGGRATFGTDPRLEVDDEAGDAALRAGARRGAVRGESLADRLAPLEEVLAELGRIRAEPDSEGVRLHARIPDDWDSLEVAEKREIVRAAVEKVTVLKASAAVPLDHRVRIDFR